MLCLQQAQPARAAAVSWRSTVKLGGSFCFLMLGACGASIPVGPGATPATNPSVNDAPLAPYPHRKTSAPSPSNRAIGLAEARRGLTGTGELAAEFHTSHGKIDCELWPDRAPLTVANFVGLARGLRAWKSHTGWKYSRFFDGTTFHRVVAGFVIQAGARISENISDPGYVIPDETWPGSTHREKGLLCMANDGPNTSASQFFILATDRAEQLDGSYTVFGSCFQTDIIDSISRVKTFGEQPASPVNLTRVTIKLEPPFQK